MSAIKSNVTPAEYAAMTDSEKEEWTERMERPYAAANGHRMQASPRFVGARPVYSSAWTSCTDDCPACAGGEPVPDW